MFKFTIRELVLVTVIVALLMAWWQARLQSAPFLTEHNKWLSSHLDEMTRKYVEAQKSLQEHKTRLEGMERALANRARFASGFRGSGPPVSTAGQRGGRSGVEPD
jgi:hypothetical protein